MARAPTTPYARVRAAFIAGQIDKYDLAHFIHGRATLNGRCLRIERKLDWVKKISVEHSWLGRRFASERERMLKKMRRVIE